ncbi:hypothetical protein GQ54DRAFT_336328 [Martensiomyces pterosporus]|nr:hypothetical protein GQ54DRAFT_336328 [Martensiomyces pterosporus]
MSLRAAAATRPTMQERSPGSHRSQHVAVRSVSSDANNRNSNIRLPSSAPSFASQSMSHLITMLREEAMAPGRKVAIIGAAGNVGASVVFSLISTSFPMDIMLADHLGAKWP